MRRFVRLFLVLVAIGLLEDHVRHCVVDAARSSDLEAEEKFSELSRTLRQALRL